MRINLSILFINVHQAQLNNSHTQLQHIINFIPFFIQSVRDLGITVSPDISWSQHVNSFASRAQAIASWTISAFRSRDRITMFILYKSLVSSHLEYSCPLCNPHKVSDIQTLEGVQRTFTARIWGVHHLDYWSRLKAFNLMSLQR